MARGLHDQSGAFSPSALLQRLATVNAQLVTSIAAYSTPPAPALECARALQRLRCERERAAIQRRIDRLQELGAGQYGHEIDALWHRKKTYCIGSKSSPKPRSSGCRARRCAWRGGRGLVWARIEDTHLSIEEKYDEVRQLINIGKEKGYLLYDEVNESAAVGNHVLRRAGRPLQHLWQRRH